MKHSRALIKAVTVTCVLTAVLCFGVSSLADGLTHDNPSLIKEGQYLALAGNCAGCHTSKADEPYAGGVAFQTEFGTLYSSNITPDRDTGIGNWTEEDFKNALRHGTRPNGEHLYPAFPYTSYTGLSNADITALFAYFNALQAITTRPPNNDLIFPFNQRWLLAIWKLLYFQPERAVNDPHQPAEWNRGAYLVKTLGHCSACHTPRNLLGAEKRDLSLSGGTYLDRIPNGEIRPWYAVDLTSSQDGLGQWSQHDIVQYLKTGFNQYATSFGPMNKVIKGSTYHLADSDIRAMAIYLKSLPPQKETVSNEASTQVLRSGQSLYSIHCATCHLPTGLGSMETGPSMVGNPVVLGRDPASLINVILYGPELPDIPSPIQRTRMESYEHKLDDDEIAAISTYMRNAWGHSASSVSAEQIKAQR